MNEPSNPLTRRGVIRAAGVAAAAAALSATGATGMTATAEAANNPPTPAEPAAAANRPQIPVVTAESSNDPNEPAVRNHRINQTVCQWCYKGFTPEQLAEHAARIGLRGMDLVGPDVWPILKKHGLIGTMTPSHSIGKGLNHKENWVSCLAAIRKSVEQTAEAGFPNVICFSGNRAGMNDEEGLANCAEALKQVVGLAEQKKVTICMELLNSKVNHPDYMCDHSEWGVKLCKTVGSDRFKLLYDIYHMQIMEGDVIATIRKHKDYFAHYHTGGVPGRAEIDLTQELYYPAVMRAIVETGYKGWVGQEFVPKRDPMESLAQAARICDV